MPSCSIRTSVLAWALDAPTEMRNSYTVSSGSGSCVRRMRPPLERCDGGDDRLGERAGAEAHRVGGRERQLARGRFACGARGALVQLERVERDTRDLRRTHPGGGALVGTLQLRQRRDRDPASCTFGGADMVA